MFWWGVGQLCSNLSLPCTPKILSSMAPSSVNTAKFRNSKGFLTILVVGHETVWSLICQLFIVLEFPIKKKNRPNIYTCIHAYTKYS